MKLNVLYPSFVAVGDSALSADDNDVLAGLAWETQARNIHKDAAHPAHTTAFYQARPENLLELYAHVPAVKRFAEFTDATVRRYLAEAYGYDCKEPVKLLAEVFCQNHTTGTSGMAAHTHSAPINFVYYPRVQIRRVPQAVTGKAGRNGEIDFFNPTGNPKKPWPALRRDFHQASIFRLEPRTGMYTVFEGYLPHSSAQFDAGGERVVIPVSCYPVFAYKNDGVTIQELVK